MLIGSSLIATRNIIFVLKEADFKAIFLGLCVLPIIGLYIFNMKVYGI